MYVYTLTVMFNNYKIIQVLIITLKYVRYLNKNRTISDNINIDCTVW